MTDFQQRVACKAIIRRDDAILLMRESATHESNTHAGKYQFPGGKIKPGEPFRDGFAREIREETSLTVTVREPFHVDEWFPIVRGRQLHIVGVFFLCDYEGGEVVISPEHDDFKWVKATELDKLDVMSPDKAIAQKYFASR